MDCKNGISTYRPNIIWIMGDQHRAQALSCNGDPNVNTPNIDRLSYTGVNLTNAVSGFPLCCPFRGSMLTSRYPHKCVPGHEYQMNPEYPTIANVFNDAGYDTAYFGKWHLDGFHESTGRAAKHIVPPQRRGGFKSWLGYENNNSQWDCMVHGGKGKDAFNYRLSGYETDELTHLFIDYIKQKGEKARTSKSEPFFAVMSVQPPHDPYVAPERFMERHNPSRLTLRENVPNVKRIRDMAMRELAGYYAQIENLDWNVGRIINVLHESGLDDNTHIMFFSDHGDMHGSHGQFRKTAPYEEAIRIPFIISGEKPNPYSIENRISGRFNVPLNHVDIAPTTLGLCGIDKPQWMEGTDYSGCRLGWRKREREPDSAYLQNVIPSCHDNSINRAWRGIVTCDGWKYICFEGIPWLMFNLNEDPYEQVNLVHNEAFRFERKKLNERLRQWVYDTGDKFDIPI